MADKYFGEQNPIGKTISYNGQQLLEIVGVVKNVPTNSTLTFDFVSSLSTLQKINQFAFDNLPNFETFLLIDRKESIPKITRNIKVASKLIATLNYNESDHYELEPLGELRFGNSYTFNEKSGLKLLYILSAIALLILSLALFNYINLATARATMRAKEVGVRKTIGASHFSLVKQFFLESTLVTFLAFLVGIGLVLLLREPFNTLFGLSIELSLLTSTPFIGILLGLFVSSTILAGLYPALILSGFSPIKVLKGNYISGSKGKKARSTMIVFQFCVSATLILCSLVMQQQINYMKGRDLGFDREQVLALTLSDKVAPKSDVFKQDVRSQTGLEQLSLSDTPFFKTYGTRKFQSHLSGKVTDLVTLKVDADFVSNLGLSWQAIPDKDAPANDEGFYVTLNEMAVKTLGYTTGTVIGQRLLNEGGLAYGKIVGIVKNFNLTSPQAEIQPMLFLVKKPLLAPSGFRIMQVRLGRQQPISDQIAMLDKIYRDYDPDSPFQYSFLEADFQKAFITQTRISYMVQIFTAVAISLACLGLFGLITFIGQTRSKEISIRKVMGASVITIFSLLSRDFLVLMLLSVLIAVPSAYYLMDQWLQDFVYRVNLSWGVFAGGGLVSLLIGLLTISYQGVKAALSNPVNALRSE
ncbi:ABC transporter permease [Spirosoma flavus]